VRWFLKVEFTNGSRKAANEGEGTLIIMIGYPACRQAAMVAALLGLNLLHQLNQRSFSLLETAASSGLLKVH
jgi:hypothetical protein